jgi:hypothetical protein
MTHVLYLSTIVLNASGVAMLVRRMRLAALKRVALAAAMTVPVFLAFDAVGAARGWFASNPALSVAIVRPGIPLEEPLLLGFLVLVAVALWRGSARILGEG